MINTKRIITLIIIVLLLNIIYLPKSLALSDVIKNGDDFLSAGGTEKVVQEGALKNTSSKIYNILLGIGITVAVIIGAILGIQFIFGSVEGKAKISEALVPYIVGCAVVFGAFGIWKIVVNTGNELVPIKETTQQEKDYGIIVCPKCKATTKLDSGRNEQLKRGQRIKLDCKHLYDPSDGSIQYTK